MTTNPNAPVMEHAWGAEWGANKGAIPLIRWVDLTARTKGAVGTQRGRQYELDQVQSGTLNGTLTNNDGALDPTNTAGPWYGHIAPYQPYRVRAQYPPTVNQIAPDVANGGDNLPLGPVPAGLDTGSDTDSTRGTVVAGGWQGVNSIQFAVPSGAAIGQRPIECFNMAVAQLTTYTFTIHVRNVTAGTTLTVKPHIGWYGPPPAAPPTTYVLGTATTLTGSTSAPWTTLTVTATSPNNAYGINVGFQLSSVAGAACSVQADGLQLEQGSTATAFVTPGTTYAVYSGFVERWPQSWTMDNTYSVISPTAVDAFALLSQRLLSDPLTEEIGKHVPRFLFKLDDPQGSQSVADASGNVTPAAIAHSKYGAGSLVFGTDITAADPVNGVFTGSGGGTVVTVNNPGAGTNLLEPATYIDLSPCGITGPDFTVEWSRMIAFRYTGTAPTAGNWATIWSSIGKNAPHGGAPSKLVLFAGDDGKAKVTVGGQSGSLTIFAPTPSSGTVLDGNWHLVGLSYDHINHLISINLDGVVTGYTDISTVIPTNLASDSLGAWIDPNTAGGSAYNFKGDIAFAAEFTTGMGTTDVSNMYAAWKNSFTGDATDVRYGRILDWAGYSGARNIQAGQTPSMGAANVGGQDALSALQAVVDTEGGSHFVSTDGTVTFKSRAARYNALTPAYTFGERTDLGEFPYEEVELDYDSTHLGNIVTVTQASTSQVFTAQDAASQLAYFPRTLARTVNSSDPLECQAAADYLLSRYKNPATRVSALKLHPAAYPSLWPVCLGLELGTRVRIMRRPIGRPAITVDAFVEQIQWELDDTGEAFVTLQCSPVDLTPYGLFASWHTTFAAGTSVGATTITINAPKDNTNPLAAQIARGQQLVVSPAGTTSKETVTVASVSSTGSPWTTGTITLTSGLTHSHTSGATICEPLPTGITDPTTWDVPSTFDSHAFAY